MPTPEKRWEAFKPEHQPPFVVFERVPELTADGVFAWAQALTPEEIAALPVDDEDEGLAGGDTT